MLKTEYEGLLPFRLVRQQNRSLTLWLRSPDLLPFCLARQQNTVTAFLLLNDLLPFCLTRQQNSKSSQCLLLYGLLPFYLIWQQNKWTASHSLECGLLSFIQHGSEILPSTDPYIQFNRQQNGQFFYNVACVTWQAKFHKFSKVRCLFIFYLKNYKK